MLEGTTTPPASSPSTTPHCTRDQGEDPASHQVYQARRKSITILYHITPLVCLSHPDVGSVHPTQQPPAHAAIGNLKSPRPTLLCTCPTHQISPQLSTLPFEPPCTASAHHAGNAKDLGVRHAVLTRQRSRTTLGLVPTTVLLTLWSRTMTPPSARAGLAAWCQRAPDSSTG